MTDIIPKTYLKETIQLHSNIGVAFLELGERLHKIREDKLYFGEYDSFEEFLLTAKITKGTASKLITVYETFQLKYKLPIKKLVGIGYSSLYAIAVHVDSKEKAEEWVERASMLTRDDLQDSLREEARPSRGCAHTDIRIVEACNQCSHRRRRYDLEKKSV